MSINGILLIDNDGTLVPGTELRNRAVLQAIVDVTLAGKDLTHTIDWNICNGLPEPQIHQKICTNGCPEFASLITPEEFEARARQGYKETKPNFTPRPGMLEYLREIREEKGIVSILVSNSERWAIEESLSESFNIAGKGLNSEYIFPITLTKTEILEAGLRPKPSGDPYRLAFNLAVEKFDLDRPVDVMILEDSCTGVESGLNFAFTDSKLVVGANGNSSELVIQFTDLANPDPRAGHHCRDMDECKRAINEHFGEKAREESIIESFVRTLRACRAAKVAPSLLRA